MTVTVDQIKQLRAQTGVSMMSCKSALEETSGDFEKAIDILRKTGEAKAVSRAGRSTGQGIIASYVHSNNKIGVLVYLACETDFVAKNEDFQGLGKDIAMHVAASAPLYLFPEDVPNELISEGKPEKMWDQIMQGKENKFRDEISLFKQQFVKNPEITIERLITDSITRIGENIKIEKFVRYAI
jgi:elongation factor Ts